MIMQLQLQRQRIRFVLTGIVPSEPLGLLSLLLLKLNSNGDTVWSKSYCDPGIFARSIRQTRDSGLIICGNGGANALGYSGAIIKTDRDGNIIWSKEYDEFYDEWFYDILETTDGGFVVTGSTESFSPDRDILCMKTDNAGNPLWSCIYSHAGLDEAYSVCSSKDGYFIAGTLDAPLPIVENTVLIKIDSLGNGCSMTPVDLPQFDIPRKNSTFTPTTHFHTTVYSQSSNFDTAISVNEICLTVSNNEIESQNLQVTIYPNPFNNNLNIKNNYEGQTEIILFDITGRKLYQNKFTNSITINTEQIEKGIYVFELKNKVRGLINGKVVKE